MKRDKQKILFILGAFCITAGIVIAKVNDAMASTPDDSNTFSVIGILMIAIGAIFISTNIVIRLIKHSKTAKDKQTHSTEHK
jgi:hypothetical protein